MPYFVQERGGYGRRVMSAVKADQRTAVQTGVAAKIEAQDREARRPRHLGDSKIGAESGGPFGEFSHRTDASGAVVQVRPGLAPGDADNFAHFGAAETGTQRLSVFTVPETRDFVGSG